MIRKVPELSLLSYAQGSTKDKNSFVDQIMLGLKDYGFIILKDHIIPKVVIDSAYEKIALFFDLDEKIKNEFICQEGGGQRGYTAFRTEHAKNHPEPDLKEFWHVGREVADEHKFRSYYPNNLWPDLYIPGFQKSLNELYAGLDQTSRLLLDAIGQGLDLPQSFFREMIDLGNSILRPIHYPPLSANTPKNAVRSAAHEDINLITILVGATSSGLQLLDRDGKWLPVENKDGELVIDSGDMLSRITNEVIPSTTHRVVNPENFNSRRYSMPFFVHPNPDSLLECIPSCVGNGAKFPPINSHEFLLQRLKEIGLMGK